MSKVIIPIGYMGSGSSAITDLLAEYNSINTTNNNFECVFLHCPNGLFDLEDKLLVGNTALRSDEAIHTFLNTMNNLYKKDGHWISNYKEKISPDFYRYCVDFIGDLKPYKFDKVYWYYQQNPVNFKMRFKLLLLRAFWKISKGKIKLKRPLAYTDTMFAFPSPEEFYSASRAFINKVLDDLGKDKGNIVIDQLLLPQNLSRFGNYFDDDTRVIVVDRDPRDVYLLNKLVWCPQNWMIPLPLDEENFCKMYRSIREISVCNDPRVLCVHFEDLVYKYDETIKRIEDFIGVSSEDHKEIRQHFDPSKSIHNTQLFKRDEFKNESVSMIERELKDYLYPYTEEIKDVAPIDSLF